MNKLVIALSSVALLTFGLIFIVGQKTDLSFNVPSITLSQYSQCLQNYSLQVDLTTTQRFDVQTQFLAEQYRQLVTGYTLSSPISCQFFRGDLEYAYQNNSLLKVQNGLECIESQEAKQISNSNNQIYSRLYSPIKRCLGF